MKVKSFRFIEYGKGTMSNPKIDISNTKRANTWAASRQQVFFGRDH